ncbi:glutamate-cysteine ligase family protein [Natronolimnohabitans sp. A-GB9]|uniref:glutamate-cysteine ligase family protein n=1 Tax=Natronolimnohabitans sp. A-GB9 TaxID=3069757 RepID=UPI0027AFF341|nr:glutamate-cysteine ligase family protein [Natronolimnohabitans sp. A-GB9]MDQ2050816.1 glutamate-cysteine ligase family protein [Natronolimnohabitans sp. A-GB9]
MKTSIEVEYWVIDTDGELTEPGPLADVSDRTEREFVEPLFELKTPPCETIDELRTTFVEQLADVLSTAADTDRRLVPLGTPINCESIDRRPGERGRIQKAVVGENFDYTKYCAGTHIHIEKRNVVDQLNTLIALDSALALVNSSPYLDGERLANSARAYCYRKKGYEEFPKHGQLWRYVDTVGEWRRRLENRYDEFKTAALEAGIDEDAVEAQFSPDDVVWTPIRLREAMPTVEWRSPDAALPSQLLRLTAELETVMEGVHHTNVEIERDSDPSDAGHVTGDGVRLPAFETACEFAETAMHDGLEDGDLVRYLDRMGFSVEDYHPIATRIDGRQYVTKADARDLRLEYASRLEEDVDELSD